MKEQQLQIDSLKKVISKPKISSKSGVINSNEELSGIDNSNTTIASLDQNAPNPFNQSTQIGYYLAENTQKAMLNIYDMNGVQIKSISIAQKGNGSVTIQASELKPGHVYVFAYCRW
jgi:hypothetical protein